MSLVPAAEQEGILNALGFNPRDPKVQALALVAQRYNLDLILKQVFLIQGTVYVSHAGLLSVAHRSGQLDGIEVEITEEPTKWIATARVYRKDMTKPFTYTDECLKNEKVQSPRKRAITRAERNALRRAFDVGVDVWEDDRPEPPVTLSNARPPLPGGGGLTAPGLEAVTRPTPTEPSPPGATEPWKSVVIRCREMALSDEDRHALVWFVTKGRSQSVKDLSSKEAGEAHKLLHHFSQTGERSWLTSQLRTAPSSSQPSTGNPAKTNTSSSESPAGGSAGSAGQ